MAHVVSIMKLDTISFSRTYYGGEQRAGVGLRAVSWGRGSFKNYVDNLRGVAGQKVSIYCLLSGHVEVGRSVVKKGQNHVHVVIE